MSLSSPPPDLNPDRAPHPAAPARRPPARLAARWRLRQAEALALIVFALALAATYSLWRVAEQQIESNRRAEFDFQARRTVRSIEQRMAAYEQVERDTQAFLLGYMEVHSADFRLFIDSIKLQERFPGIQGLALSRLVPAGERDSHVAASARRRRARLRHQPARQRAMYSSITHIEPFSGMNLRALGFDMLTEPNRRAAMERARDSGAARRVGQGAPDPGRWQNCQAGLVMYLPVYRRRLRTATLAQRRANLSAGSARRSAWTT